MNDPAGPADEQSTAPPNGAEAAPALDLGLALTQMAGVVLSRETVDTALELVTTLAASVTAGTLGAAVTIVDEHGTRSKAASNAVVERADAMQYELDEGPCLTAWRSQQLVRVDDTATDGRWPRWNEAAGLLGVRSVLSAPLLGEDESIGAMKVYSTRPQNYGPHDEQVLRMLAAQAAILLTNTQSLQTARGLARQLTAALTSRDTIAQATGVLLARGAESRQEAFVALADAAQQAGRPVEEVARTLLAEVVARNGPGEAAG